jgi:hypothetical protein
VVTYTKKSPTPVAFILSTEGFVPLNDTDSDYYVSEADNILGGDPCKKGVQNKLQKRTHVAAHQFCYLHAFNYVDIHFRYNYDPKYSRPRKFFEKLANKLTAILYWEGHDLLWNRVLEEFSKSGALTPCPLAIRHPEDRRIELFQAMEHYRKSLRSPYSGYARDLEIHLEQAKLSGI